MTIDMDHLKSWIGRQEEAHDVATAAPIGALAATLDRDDPPPRAGDPVPPLGHWLYFLPAARQSELGPDGHTKRGGFIPPIPLPRRMFAGARFTFGAPLRIGEGLKRVSTIEDVTVKEGRSGTLVFVRVGHRLTGDSGGEITEANDIVYREEPQPGATPPPPKPAPTDGAWQRTITADSVMLFRYSALTFNGHRIHYDHPYATGEEGYPGLVVHGPLTATLLADLCRRQRPEAPLATFSFRAMAPLFDIEPFTIAGDPTDDGTGVHLWAADPRGGLAMEAEATFGG